MPQPRPSEPLVPSRIFLYLSAVLLPPLLLRGFLLLEKGLPLALPDFRGAGFDLGLGLVFAALGLTLSGVGGWLAFGVAGAWSLASFMNYEYVRYFDALGSLTYVGYFMDPTFVRGSGLALSHPWLMAGSLLLLLAACWGLARRRLGLRSASRMLGLGGALIVGCSLWPLQAERASWRQTNVVWANLLGALQPIRALEPSRLARVSAEVRPLLRADLSGNPRLDFPPARRPNVLLVVLESVTGAYLPSIAADHGAPRSIITMPRLDALAQKTWRYISFTNHQRQTNRGEYSILCGDLPKLVSEQPKMTDYILRGVHSCLPELLRQAGYRTVYLQAAPLAFMFKDQFMPRAGFEEVLGHSYFRKPYHLNNWGVDDRTLFEEGLGKVRELSSSGAPWFLTMLSVSTHHPYDLPPDFPAVEGASADAPAARAFLFLDQAVSPFLEALQAEGLLENTLLLVTSDESLGLRNEGDDVLSLLSQTWGFLLFVPPGGFLAEGRTVSEMFCQSDLAISILDFLGLSAKTEDMIGRSVFRAYDRPRTIYAANTYSKRVLARAPDGIVTICPENLDLGACLHYQAEPSRPFSPKLSKALPADAEDREYALASVVEASRLMPRSSIEGTVSYPLIQPKLVPFERREGSQFFFGGQYLDAPRDTTLLVELSFEVLGQGAQLKPDHYIVGNGKTLDHPNLPPISSGQSLSLRYTFSVDQVVRGLELRLFMEILKPGSDMGLRFEKAQVSMQPSGGRPAGEKILECRLSGAPR